MALDLSEMRVEVRNLNIHAYTCRILPRHHHEKRIHKDAILYDVEIFIMASRLIVYAGSHNELGIFLIPTPLMWPYHRPFIGGYRYDVWCDSLPATMKQSYHQPTGAL